MLTEQPGAVVIGGSNVDLKARSANRLRGGTSNPGRTTMSPGGVGRNVAETLARLGDRVHLISAVGRDPLGDNLLHHTATAGVRIERTIRTDTPTGTYTAVIDVDGELVGAIADMSAIDELCVEHIQASRDVIGSAGVLVIDGNVRPDVAQYAMSLASAARVVFEPVSVGKAARSKELVDDRVFAVTPNRDELGALTGLATSTARDVRRAVSVLHERGVEVVWVRLGDRGSLLCTGDDSVEIAPLPTVVEDVTGAGDAMLGAFCHVLLGGGSVEDAAHHGAAAAALTVATSSTVRPDLTSRMLHEAASQAATP